ncbi:ribose transport system substrate-binding protein [Pseudomonas sp. SORGH_AS 211]|uniref:substrate-binding domain-containing protein n=1 Tax=Pseudomonas sp. SORGH_AS_0211 TaxID=3041796 RepID=UPI0028564C6D|nr:substrate-binding domain-containing protein [Pseudomonas sp. SORGH_AS_0211]MDR6179051.1 ribose transport system substrate-binding protein [Pseudomonas sp. SORGH_AS_0211]
MLRFGKTFASMLMVFGLGLAGVVQAAPAKRLALVQVNQQALYFTQITQGAQAAAKAAGAELVVFNANDNPSAQNDAIEAYIQDKVDAILVCAIDVNGIKPAVSAAVQAGIPVVAIDAVLKGDNQVQVGVDNRAAARQLGEYTGSYITRELGGEAKIGVVGALGSYVQNLRLDGFRDGLAQSAPKAKIVGTVDGNNVQDTAQSAAENLLTANPDLQIVYATGEPALIGTVAASVAQGSGERTRIFGWDLSPQAVQGLDDGSVAVVVQQNTRGMGKAAVEAALALLAGQQVTKQQDIPVTLVTRENLDSYRADFK